MADGEDPPRKSAAKTPGKSRRAKKTLGDDFVEAVRADFKAHGAGVIAAVRADKPDQYLKIVLSVLPRDFPGDLHVTINHLDALSDDEIRSRIRSLEAVVKPFLGNVGAEGISEPAGRAGPQTPH
jgi:hypothetical protein